MALYLYVRWTLGVLAGVLARSKATFSGFLYKCRLGSDHAKLSCMIRCKLQVPAVWVRSSCLYIPHTPQIVLGMMWTRTKPLNIIKYFSTYNGPCPGLTCEATITHSKGWLETFEFEKYLLLQSCLAYKVLHGWSLMKRPWEGLSTQNSPWSLDHPAISCLFEGTLNLDAPCRSLGSQNQFLAISFHF